MGKQVSGLLRRLNRYYHEMRQATWKLKTLFRLGLCNVLAVVLYRVAKRCGYYRFRLPVVSSLEGPFFSDTVAETDNKAQLIYFSHHEIEVSSPPDWFINPWNGTRHEAVDCHWSEIPDFMNDLGDIKTVWEASRFDWLPRLAWRFRFGDGKALGRLELWLRDWAVCNPVNGGINWKCGQEVAFRCLNLLLTALILDNEFEKPRNGVLAFFEAHLRRIIPTAYYAKAQRNNHGVSEAAALFAAGCYLAAFGNNRQKRLALRCIYKGRKGLESLTADLILSDGSFSQHSAVYHRLVVDLLSFVELFRRRLKIERFSSHFYKKARLAVNWLQVMVDDYSGEAPNLGANDGTYLFNLMEMDYRDFRPSLQLGTAVFFQQSCCDDVVRHPLLKVFSVDITSLPVRSPAQSSIMKDGGYACMKSEDGFAMLRLPMYRFRPSHSDALHLDVWDKGTNWIRDGGTYSYNAGTESLDYYPGTKSHSTVCFDDRDQMPRIGRFLFSAWLKPGTIIWFPDKGLMSGSYSDYMGAWHSREVHRSQSRWIVVDKFSGFKENAVIRWHLAPAAWEMKGKEIFCDRMRIAVQSDVLCSLSIIGLPESRYYLEQVVMPTLEIRCNKPGTVTTTLMFEN